MFPGLTTKVSENTLAAATTIYPKADVTFVSDTTTTTEIAEIVPPYGGFSGFLMLVNTSGNNIALATGGNIAVARTIPNLMMVPMAYSKDAGLWYPGAIS